MYVVAFGPLVLKQRQNGGCKAYCFRSQSQGTSLYSAWWKTSSSYDFCATNLNICQFEKRWNIHSFSCRSRAGGLKLKMNLTPYTSSSSWIKLQCSTLSYNCISVFIAVLPKENSDGKIPLLCGFYLLHFCKMFNRELLPQQLLQCFHSFCDII